MESESEYDENGNPKQIDRFRIQKMNSKILKSLTQRDKKRAVKICVVF